MSFDHLFCIGCYLVSMDGLDNFTLGTQDSAKWSAGAGPSNMPMISYSTDVKHVTVLLQCSTDGADQFEVLGEGPANNYTFRLTNKCACWNGCGRK